MDIFSRMSFSVAVALFVPVAAVAQTVSASLVDAVSGEPVSYATVYLTKSGATKPYKYVLSSESGRVRFDRVASGTYLFKAELMGYKTLEKQVAVQGKDVALGELKLDLDREALDAASVSAAGNSILIKKDTIEYNASSFKTTDNDMLEDLLKKLPGVDVSEDGSITVNGQTISKVTIDGKTFFLDDPQVASKNIPAKLINKLKVVNKKSEQAEFTGIDDGQEEQVIDLSIKPGMMNGLFGSVMGGGGIDIPSGEGVAKEGRYQGAAFLGNFKKNSQLSLLLNGNNTNNRGFNDLAGSMMGSMRGGGGGMGGRGGIGGRGGNGVSVSYMGGANGAWTLLEDRMNLGGNYLFNFTDRNVEESSLKRTYLDDESYNISNSAGVNRSISRGHRVGIRLDHKFSENTSILFEPRINFGSGNYDQTSSTSTLSSVGDVTDSLNRGLTANTGANRSFSTSGFLLLRQRLGIPGRTLTVYARYSYSNNNLDGLNSSNVYDFTTGRDSVTRQSFKSVSNSAGLSGGLTYTEPIGHNFYVEANYSYNWSSNVSWKNTTDDLTGLPAYEYSNRIENVSSYHSVGANLLYQLEKSRFQIGAAVLPTSTVNTTTRYDYTTKDYVKLDPYRYNILRWSPRAMVWWEIGENANARLFYYGNTAQPAISKLIPVPDNTDPLNVGFGNPGLKPYFTHNINGDVRYNNKKNFSSFNIRFNGSFTQDPIVSATWFGANGAQYSMPFNGQNSGSAGLNGFVNVPIGKSNFSISNVANLNWSRTSSYVGNDIDMTTYENEGYYAFMEEFTRNFSDPDYYAAHVKANRTDNLSVMERLRVTYRLDNLELYVSGRTRINKSWYTISENASQTLTFSNQVRASVNWTWDAPGLVFKSEFNYNWYNGFTGSTYTPEYILDAEIQKLLCKKKLTLSLKGYDILGQAKNVSVNDESNYHTETRNNTLGRYIILSLSYRFGQFDRSAMRHPGGPPRM